MEFDRESEFERIMNEVMPLSIPSVYIKQVVVVLKNGATVTLSGEELLKPMPMNDPLSWEKITDQHNAIEDIDVQINVDLIQENVVYNVKKLLSQHFNTGNKNKHEE